MQEFPAGCPVGLVIFLGRVVALDWSSKTPRSKFFVLDPPEEVLAQLDVGFPFICQEFGHMYSFEVYFVDFLRDNPNLLAKSSLEADYVVLPHCATYLYHMYRYRFGYGETNEGNWDAFRIVQERYLLPLVEWAKGLPAHRVTNGSNFLIVFALDKGRVDYPQASEATSRWRALTTVGNGSSWLATKEPYLTGPTSQLLQDRCAGSVEKKRRFIWYSQDVVLPVPTAFHWTNWSSYKVRPRLLFFAGTPNSCLRRFICESLANSRDPSVRVVDHALPRPDFVEEMLSARFCLVPDGFSAISARLYEVIAHGCVPAIISEAFHPPFEPFLDWRTFAVFIRPGEVPYVPQLLRDIADRQYFTLHRNLEAAAASFDLAQNSFWLTTLNAIEGGVATR